MLWAEKNDRRMLDLMEALAAEKVIGEYRKRANACGPGAVAAGLAGGRDSVSISDERTDR